MTALFVACFVGGLVLAVYVMLHGVERRGALPSAMLNAQNAAAFVVAFGACGYLVHRFTSLGGIATVLLSAAAGVACAAGSASLLAAWVLPAARTETVDERYLLQGHPARVTREIADGGTGEIAYEVDGRQCSVVARSWDGAPIDAGTDVAIERVERGVAYVERWAQVEARL